MAVTVDRARVAIQQGLLLSLRARASATQLEARAATASERPPQTAPLAAAAMPFRGRIAYPSYVDESLFGNPHEKAVQMARSMPASLKDAVVVTGAEIRGMQNRSKLGAPAPSTKQLDRQRLHALSNARKSQWPNTIEARRREKRTPGNREA